MARLHMDVPDLPGHRVNGNCDLLGTPSEVCRGPATMPEDDSRTKYPEEPTTTSSANLSFRAFRSSRLISSEYLMR